MDSASDVVYDVLMDETQTTTRTDVHRPTTLVTEDYEYLFAIDNQGPWAVNLNRDFLAELTNFAPALRERGVHQCHHCGAHIRYTAFLKHAPTGHTIVVGETCLENRFERASSDFHRLRKQAELDRKQQRIVQARNAFVEAHPELAWLNGTIDDIPQCARWSSFIVDLQRKLHHYGELSERQIAAVHTTIAKSQVRDAERASRPADPEPAPAPTGRIEIEGEVLSSQWRKTDFGSTLKLLIRVKTDETHAWKLWVSCPSKLERPENGDTIKLRVTVEASHDDPAFAFGKRPTIIS